jgi:hypothetical protein
VLARLLSSSALRVPTSRMPAVTLVGPNMIQSDFILCSKSLQSRSRRSVLCCTFSLCNYLRLNYPYPPHLAGTESGIV